MDLHYFFAPRMFRGVPTPNSEMQLLDLSLAGEVALAAASAHACPPGPLDAHKLQINCLYDEVMI